MTQNGRKLQKDKRFVPSKILYILYGNYIYIYIIYRKREIT